MHLHARDCMKETLNEFLNEGTHTHKNKLILAVQIEHELFLREHETSENNEKPTFQWFK